ncbi:hypothetical protein AVE30378_01032 [Achromobacter veterisilvae]|uniref:Uncharacterized protein n=1 Tax=Achromobacter veterisilvae TaxID=2069367 RepID=A0A446C944_9BURK|nr:hypothetical protein [Achromobacter veterisilvae]SSW64330.1 hypothetical protein AVE30378_01032 [Achromobacter veterisilvae]
MTTHEQTARNAEIVRRRLDGEGTSDLSREYGVTPTRIAQLVRRHREKAGEIPKTARQKKQPAQRIRPRLRKAELGLWLCTGEGVERRGETPTAAYERWLKASLAGRVAAHLAPKPAEPEQPYAGPVMVVPGTKVAPRALTLPPAMRFAMERAGLVQSRLITLPGT